MSELGPLMDLRLELTACQAENKKMSAVVEAARKCKNGCRRCNAFDRYAVLKDALAALDEET